jgi:hypothetical protein
MEQIKNIVELLSKLEFSFWQIFGFIVIMLFREQIIAIFNRIVTIKSPVGEIGLIHEKSKVIEKYKNIENKVLSLPDENEVKNDISEGLQSLHRELSIDALKRIRTSTTFLWPALVLAFEKQQTKTHEAIRRSTFLKIKNDLELLNSFGLLEYSCKHTGKLRNDSTLEITVEINKKLFDLIECIQEGR